MTAILVLALLAVQIVATIFFAHDRERALILASRTQILDRTVGLVRLLSIAPESEWGRFVDVMQSRGFRASIDSRSRVGQKNEYRENFIARGVRNRVEGAVPGPFLADFEDDDHLEQRYRHGKIDHHRGPLQLIISIGLGKGQWLNLEHRLRPPPFWRSRILIYIGLTAAAVCLAGLVMVRRITRPIRALVDASDRFGRGEDVGPLPERGPDELARATAAFNRMRSRISRFVDDRTQMLAAISHDLRTPITALRLRAEFLEEGEHKEKILSTLQEMEAMTNSSLDFIRKDAQSEAIRATDLTSLIDSVTEDLVEQGADITFEDKGRMVVSCRPVAIKRAIRNLIENAVNYGNNAVIDLVQKGDQLSIIIDDCGSGIADADLERVFDPFVRLEKSRSRETGGTGLGLSIARNIARGHGGDVFLENRPEGGLRAVLTLPVG